MKVVDLMRRANQAARFLFEIGTLRRLMRMHAQVFGSSDSSDNIASHSYRTAVIGWILAMEQGLDESRVIKMCLLHDMGETRTGDHNWVHKRYVKCFDEEVMRDQLGTLPWPELQALAQEYEERETDEAKIAKDADHLDQLMLVKEYEHSGNKEAARWLTGRERRMEQLRCLYFSVSKRLGEAVYEARPSEWWDKLHTNKNR